MPTCVRLICFLTVSGDFDPSEAVFYPSEAAFDPPEAMVTILYVD